MEQNDQLVNRCVKAIKSSGARSVGLQYAAALRTRAVDIASKLEKISGVPVFLSADSSFGACDVRDMPVDMIVHLGHAPIPDLHFKNVFFFDDTLPPPESLDFVDKALPLPGKTVGLLTTTQFRGWLPRVREHLESKGYKVLIGRGGRRIAYDGQLLGCDYSAARAV